MKKLLMLLLATGLCLIMGSCVMIPYNTPARGHEYVETVTAPTCTEKGYTTSLVRAEIATRAKKPLQEGIALARE